MYDDSSLMAPSDARRWAMFCHLGGLAAFSSIPFGGIIVPLIIWLMKRDEHPFIDEAGKDALNFQISWSIWFICLGLVIGILCIILIGLLFLPVLFLFPLVQGGLAIYAAIRANDGWLYKYPLTIPFLN